MNEITFKVAKRGEGKTRWLIDIAHKYEKTNCPVFYCTDLESEYGNFCEKYFRTYNTISKVEKLSLAKLTGNEVVLIDDMMAMNFTIKDIAYIQKNCYKLYITLTGETEDSAKVDLNQLSFFHEGGN